MVGQVLYQHVDILTVFSEIIWVLKLLFTTTKFDDQTEKDKFEWHGDKPLHPRRVNQSREDKERVFVIIWHFSVNNDETQTAVPWCNVVLGTWNVFVFVHWASQSTTLSDWQRVSQGNVKDGNPEPLFFFCWHWWQVKRWGHEGVAISIIVPARIIHLYWRVLDVLKNNSYNYPKCPSKCLSTYSLWAVLSELGNSDFGVQLERTIRFSTQTCHKMENYLLLMSQCLPQHWEEQDDGSVISPPQGAFLTRGSIYDLTQSLSSGRFSLRWAVTRNLFTVQTCELTPIREEKNQSGRNSILAKFFYLG